MKVLIADKVAPDMISQIEALGGKVDYKPDLKAESLPGAVGDAVILIVRSTKVTAETIAAGNALRMIIRAGAGVNTIALDAASERGIYVTNCPGMNTEAVAELAMGLAIAADRRIADATVAMREGKWLKGDFGKARGLYKGTFGIIGMGQIGRATARRAQGFGMHVIAWSRSLTDEAAEEMGVQRAANVIEVAQKSDVVSVHLAAAKGTKGLLNAEFFAAMKKGSIFVNTSRGEIVDTAAMTAAIKDKGLRVGLDVFENEPAGNKADFTQKELAAQVVCTPHIGASTDQASAAISAETVRIVSVFMKTGQAENVVNLRAPIVDKTHLAVRHFNRVGVLAQILNPIRDQGINVEEMQDAVFQGGTAACCSLTLDSKPSQQTLAKIQAISDVMAVAIVG